MGERLSHVVLRSSYEDDLYFAWRNNYSPLLKQHALLFNQIGIFRLHNLREVMSSFINHDGSEFNSRIQTFISDTEWLQENEVIFEPDIDNEFEEGIDKILQAESSITSNLRSLNKILKDKLNEQKPKNVLDAFKSSKASDGILLRMMSLTMESTRKVSVVTTLPYSEYTHKLPDNNLNEVVQIVISKLPLPDGTIPWEKVTEYREDTDSQKNLLALRRWIKKISSQNLSLNETEEELEWLMNEFQSHMNLHKIKANTETLEVMIKAPLEIIENLIKLKLSKIPDPLFAIKKRQISLMEAELNAPGREMAYIIKTRETFQSQE